MAGLMVQQVTSLKIKIYVGGVCRCSRKVYSEQGEYKLSLEQILSSFELTALYVGAVYQPLYAFYGLDTNPSPDDAIPTHQEIDNSAVQYVQKLLALSE